MSLMRPRDFQSAGVIYYNGHKFTYYDEKVLSGPNLPIPGRHTDDNLVKDGNGNVSLASCDYSIGTSILTPLLDQNGNQYNGVVYDVCPTSGTVDIYVNF